MLLFLPGFSLRLYSSPAACSRLHTSCPPGAKNGGRVSLRVRRLQPPKGQTAPHKPPPFSWAFVGTFYIVRYYRLISGASRGIRTLDTWFRSSLQRFSSHPYASQIQHLSCIPAFFFFICLKRKAKITTTAPKPPPAFLASCMTIILYHIIHFLSCSVRFLSQVPLLGLFSSQRKK